MSSSFKLKSGNTPLFKMMGSSPINRKDLEEGTLAQANKDGSVDIDESVPHGSALEKRVGEHEQVHADEMKAYKKSGGEKGIMYTDDKVIDNVANKEYDRKDGNLIDKETGEVYEEGAENLPHEQRANNIADAKTGVDLKDSAFTKMDVYHYTDEGAKKISYDEGVKLTNQQQHIKFTGEDLKRALNDPNVTEFSSLSQDEKTRIINQDERDRLERVIEEKNKKNPPTYDPEIKN